MVNQNVQDALKKFQDTKNYDPEMTQKQIKDFNKHQSETRDTIEGEIHELKRTIQNIKRELNKDMKNLRKNTQAEILEIKSPFSQTKNTVESQSSRLEQVEDRISELKIKWKLKKNRRILSQTTREL
jgi:hypothetical protein